MDRQGERNEVCQRTKAGDVCVSVCLFVRRGERENEIERFIQHHPEKVNGTKSRKKTFKQLTKMRTLTTAASTAAFGSYSVYFPLTASKARREREWRRVSLGDGTIFHKL